jgi:hypothetical protein
MSLGGHVTVTVFDIQSGVRERMTKPTSQMIQKAKVVMKAAVGDPRCGAIIEMLGEFFPGSRGTAWLDDDLAVGKIFTSEQDGWLTDAEDAEFWRLVGDVDTSRPGFGVPADFGGLLNRVVTTWQVESDVEHADDLYELLEVAAVEAAAAVCAVVRGLDVSEATMSEADIVDALSALAAVEPEADEPAGSDEGSDKR